MESNNKYLEADETALSLGLFIVLARSLRSIDEYIQKNTKKSGLNGTEFGVLELLYHKGPQAHQKIGEKILLASGSITYVVDKLEGKGLLRRESCSKDRRIIYAVITDEGKRLMDKIFPEHKEAIHKSLAGLDMDEKRQVIDLLKKLGLYAKNL